MLANVKKLIVPYFKKLSQSHLDENQKTYIEVIESSLHEIISTNSVALSSDSIGLTRSELIVADLIKQGQKTKEIALLLALSQKTIEVHRSNIRNKLGIKNKKINLQTYLNTMK